MKKKSFFSLSSCFLSLCMVFALSGCGGPDDGKFAGGVTGALLGATAGNGDPLATLAGVAMGTVVGAVADDKRAKNEAIKNARMKEDIMRNMSREKPVAYQQGSYGPQPIYGAPPYQQGSYAPQPIYGASPYQQSFPMSNMRQEIIRSLESRSGRQFIDDRLKAPVSIIPLDFYFVGGQEHGRFRCIVNPGQSYQSALEGFGYKNNNGTWSVSIPQ